MLKHTTKNSHFIPALNALAALTQWLKPGLLSFRLGQLKSAVEPTAVSIEKQHQALIDECVIFDHEAPSGPDDKRVTDDRPKKRRTKLDEQGRSVYDFGTRASEFERRYKELIDGETTIVVTRLITEADIEAIEKNRIEPKRKKLKDGTVETQEMPPVDFAALMPFMEQPKVEPESPAAVGADDEDGALE
jgi:hypothetical protein